MPVRIMMKLARANGDKPHRCPGCHKIPNVIWESKAGKARLYRTYRCSNCGIRWWRGWHD